MMHEQRGIIPTLSMGDSIVTGEDRTLLEREGEKRFVEQKQKSPPVRIYKKRFFSFFGKPMREYCV